MTDRDYFAAAALTGLLAQGDDGSFSEESYVRGAYRWADAMLRERAKTNHDAAPAARASEATASPERVRDRGDAGTGDTQSFDAYRRFVGEVMNWISEATSAYAASCKSDGGRKIMADACSKCWDAFDRIAYPTDKAAPRPSEGTGDTPVTEPMPVFVSGSGSVTPVSYADSNAEPVAWATFYPNGSTASVYVGRKPPHAEPLYRQPPCQDFSQQNLTLTDAEREAVEYYIGTGGPQAVDDALRRLVKRHGRCEMSDESERSVASAGSAAADEPTRAEIFAALDTLTRAIGCYGERIDRPFVIRWGNGLIAGINGEFEAGGIDNVTSRIARLQGRDWRTL